MAYLGKKVIFSIFLVWVLMLGWVFVTLPEAPDVDSPHSTAADKQPAAHGYSTKPTDDWSSISRDSGSNVLASSSSSTTTKQPVDERSSSEEISSTHPTDGLFDLDNPPSLETLLSSVPVHPKLGKRIPLLSTVNEGFLEFFMNLACSYKTAGIDMDSVIVVTLDEEARAYLLKRGIKAWFLGSSVSKGQTNYGTDEYKQVIHAKTAAVYEVLRRTDIFFVDSDIVVFRDFTKSDDLYVPEEEQMIDIQFQCEYRFHEKKESPVDQCPPHTGDWINSGFYFARSTPQTLKFFEHIIKNEKANPTTTEQLHGAALLNLMYGRNQMQWYNKDRKLDRKGAKPADETERPLTVRMLDPVITPNGHIYFLDHVKWMNAMDQTGRQDWDNPYIAHANWLFLKDKKPTLKKFSMWYIDEDGNCM